MKILFVCTGNTCRSSMAEGLFKDLIKKYNLYEKFCCGSAGTFAGYELPASANAIKALSGKMIDISNHSSKPVEFKLVKSANLVLTMTKEQKNYLKSNYVSEDEKIFTLAEYASGKDDDICDPYGGNLDSYLSCRDEIDIHLKLLIEKLKNK